MRRSMCLLVAGLLTAGSSIVSAQTPTNENALAKEFAGQVDGLAKKWTSLLEAMPESKLDWRPGEGVRSVRELFTHIGDANSFFMTFVGAKMPDMAGMPKDQKERENRLKSKAELVKHVARSFESAKAGFAQLSTAQLDAEVNMFGSKTTGRNAMLVNLGHMHEHLGQAIAYARMNGVTPPWSMKGE